MLKVKIRNKSDNPDPKYSTPESAGLDIYAHISTNLVIKPGETALVPTGLFIEIPSGYEAQVRPRSGLALKKGITVLNTPGTIDADYRGEIGVILINHSRKDFEMEPGDRIAQLVFHKYEKISWVKSESLSDSQRGEGGFGHSGKK